MSPGEIVLNVLFYIFAVVAIGGAVAVAASANIVRSAFALLAVLFATAAFYAFMRADFVFAAQILIYVGGILVLIIFAIMLTHRITDVKISNESTHGLGPALACGCVLAALLVVALIQPWDRAPGTQRTTTLEALPGAGVRGYEVRVALAQADAAFDPQGGTGLVRGGTLLDGHGFATVSAPFDVPEWMFGTADGKRRIEGVVRVRLFRETEKGTWVPVPPRGEGRISDAHDVALGPSEGLGYAGRLELTGLEEGNYRWAVNLAAEGHATLPAVSAGVEPDFVVHRGLTRPIGRALMGPYLLPFEVVSVLLLAALVGAAFLARKEVRR